MEVGSSVRHQQVLIKLPDLSEMDVNVKLHESVVKQASLGAPAYVTIDAFQKDRLTGKVSKIAVMPDRQNWWLNPGLKVYRTDVALDATPKGLKPGMSAQVEILADTRNDVLQVPISAVHVDKGFQVVYVKTLKGPEVRRIEAGLSNDQAVEMVKGVDEGEEVYLYKPDGAPEIQVSEEEIQAQRAFEEEAAAARAKAEREEPAALPDMPDLKNLDPEQTKAMREKFEKLPKAERDALLKRLRESGAAAGATDKPDRPAKGEETDRADKPRSQGRRQP